MTVLASFFTDSWEYPEHADRLKGECSRLGIEHIIERRPDAGGYLENCRIKPVFLLETMERVSKPLLWLDVDSSLVRLPDGIDTGLDFMARQKPVPGDGRAWHVDVMWFNASPGALALLRLWVRSLAEDSDEAAFDRAWKSGRWKGPHAPLPASYSPGAPDPVVVHGRSTSPEKSEALRRLREEREARRVG